MLLPCCLLYAFLSGLLAVTLGTPLPSSQPHMDVVGSRIRPYILQARKGIQASLGRELRLSKFQVMSIPNC